MSTAQTSGESPSSPFSAPTPVQGPRPAARARTGTLMGISNPEASSVPPAPPAHTPSEWSARPADISALSPLSSSPFSPIPESAAIHDSTAPGAGSIQDNTPTQDHTKAGSRGLSAANLLTQEEGSGPPSPVMSVTATVGYAIAPSMPTAGAPRVRLYGQLVLGLTAALLLSLGAFVWFWRPQPPLHAELISSGEGSRVAVTCDNCADGTLLRFDGHEETFTNHRTVFALSAPLSVGDNELVVDLDRPGLGRDEGIQLTIPVLFQLEADLGALEQPQLGIRVMAAQNATVTVNGAALPLSRGAGTARVDVSSEAVGPRADVAWLSHTFQVAVTADGKTEQRHFEVRGPVVPLSIEAPSPRSVVDSPQFMLAGQTAPGATLTVSNTPIPVAADGHFAQLMSIDAEGETEFEVRAHAPSFAPRLVRLTVGRVADRRRAAREIAANAVRRYSVLREQLEAHAQPEVALVGRIQEARSNAYSTTALLEVTAGCDVTPCFVRVVHGSKQPWTPGRTLSVFGRATQLVTTPLGGTPIPEVAAYFVLP